MAGRLAARRSAAIARFQKGEPAVSLALMLDVHSVGQYDPRMSGNDLPAAVRRLVDDCLNVRSTEAMNEIFAPEYVHRWGFDGALPLTTYVSVMTRWFAAFPDFTVEPEMVLTGGDLVAVRYRCTATRQGQLGGHEPTGRTVQWRENFWYRLCEDRIAEDWEDYDFAGILEQIS